MSVVAITLTGSPLRGRSRLSDWMLPDVCIIYILYDVCTHVWRAIWGFVCVSCHMDTSNYRSSPNDRLLWNTLSNLIRPSSPWGFVQPGLSAHSRLSFSSHTHLLVLSVVSGIWSNVGIIRVGKVKHSILPSLLLQQFDPPAVSSCARCWKRGSSLSEQSFPKVSSLLILQ